MNRIKEKLGTYGVIKGANQYIGTTIKLEPMTLEALGYEMEAVILYLAHLGLGTCWLGGTFDREGFADAMKIKEGEVFPIITPYGYAAANKHEMEIEMRKMIEADKRTEWSELFYKNDFKSPLTKEEAGDLAFALELDISLLSTPLLHNFIGNLKLISTDYLDTLNVFFNKYVKIPFNF